jgi:hypothetical protein
MRIEQAHQASWRRVRKNLPDTAGEDQRGALA